MNLTFYYAPMSTATVTDLVIEELGLPVKRVKLDIKSGDTKKPEYLKLNPNGKVPLLVHDDTPIWESAAITMYLGEMFGVDKKLYPAMGPMRGEAMKWITWANVTLCDAVYTWARHTQDWLPADHRNVNAAAAAKKDLERCLSILDQAVANKPYLLSEYTLVDTHLNSFMDWLRYMKIDFAAYMHLNAWSARCSARPAYAKVMLRES